MCTSQRWIYNKYNHHKILVPCGKCKSCQQEKANRRTARIRHQASIGGYVALFCTLTYANSFIPYIRRSDLESYIDAYQRYFSLFQDSHDWLSDSVGSQVRDKGSFSLPVYRDFTKRRCRVSANYKMQYKPVKVGMFDTIEFDKDMIYEYECNSKQLTGLRRKGSEYIGICYYKDVQDFFKRVRIRIKRELGYVPKFHFYSCTEYGETYRRPHAHLLVFVPASQVEVFWRALDTSWPFNGKMCRARKIEYAVNASSYVASYVNSGADFPRILSSRSLKQKHSYSQGFGAMARYLSLASIMEKADKGDMRYLCQTTVNGVPETRLLPIPEYAVHRYFPDFKGNRLLTDAETIELLDRPEPSSFFRYARRLELTSDEVHSLAVRFSNSKDRYLNYFGCLENDNGFAPMSYGMAYVHVRNAMARSMLRQFYENDEKLPVHEQYDNILDVVRGYLRAPTLEPLLEQIDGLELDPNKFTYRVQKTRTLEELFDKKLKTKKVSNYCMVNSGCDV